jgi:N-methylhydantoinase A
MTPDSRDTTHPETTFQIGCDIGGTFTDVCVIDSRGTVFTDKSETTPEDLTVGVLAALESISAGVGLPLDDLLSRTSRFVNGTTVVTNSIAELVGSRVGLLVTKGFRDTLRIARSPRNGERDFQLQHNVPDLVPRDCIVELEERIDRNGNVVVALQEEDVRTALQELAAKGVESLAVCLLFSFANTDHEELVARVAEAEFPDLYLSVSSRLYPVMREYERTVTTVLNSYTGVRVAVYTDKIEKELNGRGLRGPISFMQGFGGTLPAAEARRRPISLIDSGPAGGVVGARRLAEELDIQNVITGDMGGTSFDVSVLPDREISVTHRVMLREFLTGVSKVDVLAIGAGGGSLGWIDARGVPQVGPRSAGAFPGPAAYGRGGEDATVTDAVVALGILAPSWFLGGRRTLDTEAARNVVAKAIGDPLGIETEDAASAIYRLVTASMSDAVRRVTVERGRDPREFTMCAYGGALGVFAADICRRAGIRHIVIPREAGVFSAYGLLATDDIRVLSRSIVWTGGSAEAVGVALRELEDEAVDGLRRSGHGPEATDVVWQGDFKFAGQIFELTVPIDRDTDIDAALARVQAEFPSRYEKEYGPGTAWGNADVVMLGVRVLATGRTAKLERGAGSVQHDAASAQPVETRDVMLPGERRRATIDVFAGTSLGAGARVAGPAIIEHALTTIFVPTGWRAEIDAHGRQHLHDLEPTPGMPAEHSGALADVAAR